MKTKKDYIALFEHGIAFDIQKKDWTYAYHFAQ